MLPEVNLITHLFPLTEIVAVDVSPTDEEQSPLDKVPLTACAISEIKIDGKNENTRAAIMYFDKNRTRRLAINTNTPFLSEIDTCKSE